MDSQFTASEHLNGLGQFSLGECPQVHDLQASLCGAVLGTLARGNQRVSGMSLCESGRLIQSVDVLVKAQSRAVVQLLCTCANLFVVLSFFLHSWHALTIHIDQACHQVSSQISGHFIVHSCSHIVEQIVDVPVPQNSGAHYHWVAPQTNCAWQRSCDSMTTNMADVLKLGERPTPHDNDERTWLEFRFKLETTSPL